MRRTLIAALCLSWSTPSLGQTLTKPPALTAFIEAETPPPGAAIVVLQIDIDATGEVSAAQVIESGGAGFDTAALRAAKRFVFSPAEVDGAAAAIRIEYRYAFTETIITPPPPTTVRIQGQVVRADGAVVSQAQIQAGDRTARTDAQGRFDLSDLAPGIYVVLVSGDGLISVRTTEDARTPGAELTVRYTLAPKAEDVDEELVIRAPRQIRAQTQVAIGADEARTVAGTQGDTLKVVQSLPGVARAAAGSAALVVWGAAPEDTRVLVDGVEIPALYHIGGVRSTLNSALVESIELVPGAFGPAYGRGLGGIVKVKTRRLSRDAFTGYVAADLYDASTMLSAPVTDAFRVGAAARVGYLDRVFAGIADDAALFPIPRYLDAQLKLEHDLRADEWIGLTALLSDDALTRQIDEQRDRQTRRSLTVLLPYRRITPAGASFKVTPYFGLGTRTVAAQFGLTPARQSLDTMRFGLRADYRASLGDDLTLAFGVDGLSETTAIARSGSLNRPPREGDVAVFGQPPGDDVTADALRVTQADVAVHGRVEWTLGDFTVVPGVRLDVFATQSDRLDPPIGEAPRLGLFRIEPALAPRLSARWAALDSLTVHAATGQYHQPPRAADLSPVFGNPRLTISDAVHLVGGLKWTPLDGLDAEVTGFYERFDNLVARAPETTPPLGEALRNDGTGESKGVQLLLRRSAGDLTGWISYTLSRSERIDSPGAGARLFDYDQTHVLSVVLSHSLKPFTFGARARYATGFPRTPVVDAFYDARSDRFQPVFGAQNSTRIAAFTQLDLRIEYTTPLPVGTLAVSLDVQNATNVSNVEELAYTFDFKSERPVPGLPLLTVLGARWDF
ncbi:MAG: TonB family protein [Bradymonadia bacterium]|jgi:TonB family protein